MKTARDIMATDLVTVTPATPLREFARLCAEDSISGAPVVNVDGTLAGIVSRTDLLDRLLQADPRHAGEAETLTDVWLREDESVENIMASDVIAVAPDATLPAIAGLLAENGIHRVAVTENDQCIGLVSSLDLLRHYPA
ncbi:MAG: CBS domain-containing protein [Planctomycetota bacterium]